MNEITSHDFGLLRREVRDARTVLSRLDHQMRQQAEPGTLRRPAGLVARLAAVALISRAQRQTPDAVARQYFRDDRDLAGLIEIKTAIAPAQTTVTGWASELAAIVVQDIADNLLPQSALSQLRAQGLAYGFVDGAVARTPIHTPVPSGGFVLEANAIPVGALILSSFILKPKKAAAITSLTRELLQGSPVNVELSLRVLLAQDLGLAIDGILLGNTAVSAAAPAGLLNGLTSLTPSVASTTGEKIAADIRALLNAIAPAIRPVLIMNAMQAASIGVLAQAPLPVIVAPYLAAGTVIAVDAAAFASALGVPDFSTDENPTVHMESAAPLPPVSGAGPTAGALSQIAAPTQSLWQTACIGMRTLIDCDWLLRRTGAVAFVTPVTW
jgi:hypothetical protein